MVIGITGGIGTGKSTILRILKEKYNFTIFETDKIAHELMMKGNVSYLKIVDYFGNDILDENNEIDRKKLGQKVFNDKKQLEKLNEFVHPEVIHEIQNRIEKIENNSIIEKELNSKKDSKDKKDLQMEFACKNNRFVIEAALLFESGCNTICDKVWYIDTKSEIRKQRLKESRNMTDEQIESVMKNQLDKEQFEGLADIVIDNSDSIESTEKQIQNILEF